jgi:NAD(P)-dependent dehydrogenase (short-subunit alcohol dehydrogenase family)
MSKVWFVTGSSRGLGMQIARTLLEAGEDVIATARRESAIVDALGKRENLLPLSLDVTDESAAIAAAQEAIARFGGIDVLINNAGYGHFGPFEEATAQEVDNQFRVNLFGAMNVTRAILPAMRSWRSGRIFNITSIAGITGFPMCSLYCASKFAMEGWSDSLAMELQPLGIQVTAVAPGFFRTEFLAAESVQYIQPRHPEYVEGMTANRNWLDEQHQKQLGDPVKLAQVLMRLADQDIQPPHLIAGSDALQRMEARIKRDADALAEWRHLSESTDFPS